MRLAGAQSIDERAEKGSWCICEPEREARLAGSRDLKLFSLYGSRADNIVCLLAF